MSTSKKSYVSYSMDNLSIIIHSKLEHKYQLTNLLSSIQKHNVDNIPVHLIVFNGEQGEFSWASNYVKGIYEEASVYQSRLKDPRLKVSSMLLNLYKTQLSSNYLILSSFCIFYKDFTKDMFLTNGIANVFISPPRVWEHEVLEYINKKYNSLTTDQLVAWLHTTYPSTFDDGILYSDARAEYHSRTPPRNSIFPEYGNELSENLEVYQNQLSKVI